MELTRLEYAKAHAAGFAEFLGHGLLDSDEGEGGRQTKNQAGDVPFEKSEWRSQRVGIGDERRHEIGTVDGDHFVGWSLTGWPVLAN